jgi:hypothetical protein
VDEISKNSEKMIRKMSDEIKKDINKYLNASQENSNSGMK